MLALIPHPDDETLGCGGLLASCYAAGWSIDVLLVTDGAASHPKAASFSAAQRRDVRERELLAALEVLGRRGRGRVVFWRKPDSLLPQLSDEERQLALTELCDYLREGQYHTVLVPWRRDPHGDHRATYELLQAALRELPEREQARRVLEYCVWLGRQGALSAFPQLAEEALTCWAHEVSPEQREQLRRALACHASQLGRVFDDPTGFVVPPWLASSTERREELFLESHTP